MMSASPKQMQGGRSREITDNGLFIIFKHPEITKFYPYYATSIVTISTLLYYMYINTCYSSLLGKYSIELKNLFHNNEEGL